MKVKVAGGLNNYLIFDPGIHKCGKIKDGVGFDTGDGWWVVSFEDLEKMYTAAKKARAPLVVGFLRKELKDAHRH